VRRIWIVLGLLAVSAGAFGCGDETTEPDGPVYARALTHPDSLIHDLQTAYRSREIAPYANLLARDFAFVFWNRGDPPDAPSGLWGSAEDSTATAALFAAKTVADIRIALTWFPPEETTLDGVSVQRVIVAGTMLDVDLSDGVTLRVDGDQQYFFFRPGRPDLEEDSGRLYLVRWEDRDGSGGAGKSPLGRPAVEATTWALIKNLFR